MKRLNKKELEKKAKIIDGIVNGLLNNTLDIPNNAVIYEPEVLLEIFTKKRLELVQYIKNFKPKSVTKLAEMTGRKKQAVNRDLKFLQKHELITLEKKGRFAIPKLEQRIMLLNVGELYAVDMPKSALVSNRQATKIKAQVFVDGTSVNEKTTGH